MKLVNKKRFCSLPLIWLLAFITVCGQQEPLVQVNLLDSSILVDVKYATPDNFVGSVLYDTNLCFLRQSVAKRLVRVQQRLQQQGLGLKILDGYRPLSVQKKMWKLMPDSRYVADPQKGSRHNRGAAVDVTLVDHAGRELEMPTAYDDFTEKAHRDYQALPPAAIQHRAILQQAMQAEGFLPLTSEWWHFDAPNWQNYALLDIPLKTIHKR